MMIFKYRSNLRRRAVTPPIGPMCVVGGILATILLAAVTSARAHDDHGKDNYGNKVSITVQGDRRCIISNGLPNHSTGQFPNPGNPNTISAQSIRLCVTTHPHKNSEPRPVVRGPVGVAINGIEIRPGTADFYDPSSPRGFSRNPSSGWRLEGLGARAMLGMDRNNAHVDFTGLYHYHGVPEGLVATLHGSSLIGYAADGFEIHYVGNRQTSSYRLKSGTRPSGPGGKYDGTFVQDWEYVPGSGTLDVCNGGMLNGKYVYFATRTYPFFPRCLWGDKSADFDQRQGPGPGFRPVRMGPGAMPFGREPPGNAARHHGPPPEAISACAQQPNGARCTFRGPVARRTLSGVCRMTPGGVSACVPRGGRPRGPRG